MSSIWQTTLWFCERCCRSASYFTFVHSIYPDNMIPEESSGRKVLKFIYKCHSLSHDLVECHELATHFLRLVPCIFLSLHHSLIYGNWNSKNFKVEKFFNKLWKPGRVTFLFIQKEKKIKAKRKNVLYSLATPQINVCKQLQNNTEYEYYFSNFFPSKYFYFSPDCSAQVK